MRGLGAALLLCGTAALAGCGSSPNYRQWSAKDQTVAQIAFDECEDQVNSTMRLRGYPPKPLPETPQFQYREAIFSQCMRKKGYEPQ